MTNTDTKEAQLLPPIHTPAMTYAMEVSSQGYVRHVHWGPSVDDDHDLPVGEQVIGYPERIGGGDWPSYYGERAHQANCGGPRL